MDCFWLEKTAILAFERIDRGNYFFNGGDLPQFIENNRFWCFLLKFSESENFPIFALLTLLAVSYIMKVQGPELEILNF